MDLQKIYNGDLARSGSLVETAISTSKEANNPKIVEQPHQSVSEPPLKQIPITASVPERDQLETVKAQLKNVQEPNDTSYIVWQLDAAKKAGDRTLVINVADAKLQLIVRTLKELDLQFMSYKEKVYTLSAPVTLATVIVIDVMSWKAV